MKDQLKTEEDAPLAGLALLAPLAKTTLILEIKRIVYKNFV